MCSDCEITACTDLQDSAVDALDVIPEQYRTLPIGETDEEVDLYEAAAKSAQEAGAIANDQEAGAIANDPLRLLAYAQSAMARQTSGRFNADLCYALREIKGTVTKSSDHSSGAASLRSLTFLDLRAFLWGSLELCCDYLSCTEALDQHPVCTRSTIAGDKGTDTDCR